MLTRFFRKVKHPTAWAMSMLAVVCGSFVAVSGNLSKDIMQALALAVLSVSLYIAACYGEAKGAK